MLVGNLSYTCSFIFKAVNIVIHWNNFLFNNSKYNTFNHEIVENYYLLAFKCVNYNKVLVQTSNFKILGYKTYVGTQNKISFLLNLQERIVTKSFSTKVCHTTSCE